MGQLVHHHIVHRLGRVLHQAPGKAQAVFAAARAKPLLGTGNLYPGGGHPHPLGKIGHPLRDHGRRLTAQLDLLLRGYLAG